MLNRCRSILRDMLNESRYKHSIGVSITAKELAGRFGCDTYKAEVAGLVHDCAKNIPYDKLLSVCKKYGYIPDEIEIKNPGLIHAPLGARMLGRVFGINDAEISRAVCNHTVAAHNMTKLDKIIYLADMIEPDRRYGEADELRKLAEKDLDTAFLKALDFSLVFNISKGVLIHPNTLYARNELLL